MGWQGGAVGGGGLSPLDRLPPLTHVLGRLLLYYIILAGGCSWRVSGRQAAYA